ncbi:inositol monophosphatase family protein [Aureimonas phyllosphaerae]|uniref:Inositol-1-monophosphatase n=1 Tax=Aureimonas phyllosphaerae TaxID=1166078 RepID=A0A7W6FWQ6_9HYPH|nr:inositol monophosphatase [Aureimonas phyllosphaerae]MBB3938175.1 myo-inositol-1(or 4)-monophosphatase [Aureimonas phyllosphaerae]MBB3962199.1 myo-inositol-1(or 4)-monophosphatase [Aureimonas phyllosphaerae]SFF57464.1 myo-inositol-1(or 4)-monophosphatase [Aureimonas phyllosphaerae]
MSDPIEHSDTTVADRQMLAEAIAREGGRIALAYFRDRSRLTIDQKTSGQDVVSIADKEVETLLRERIAASFPDDGLLGEEYGLQEGTSGFRWVMDPIDGTSPFVFGIPAWCVSIAIMRGDAIVAGVIYAPTTDELYSARRGGGATLNGQPIHVSSEATLQSGVLGLGANHRIPSRVVSGVVQQLLDEGGMFIRNGSGALMMAYVAAGRLAAYWEPHMNAWDCYAGYVLIKEAGGWIVDPSGWSSMSAGGAVIVGSPGTKADLLRIVGANAA